MQRVATKTAVPYMNKENCNSIPVTYPSLPEQQKIASFFTAVDIKIQQLTKKRTLLETYKKGLMQKLFSQQLQFKDEEGNDYPNWEKKKFSEVFTFINTNSFSRSQLNYTKGTVKNIHYGDIHTKFQSNFNIKNEVVPYVNGEIDLQKISNECFCIEGDLIIADHF